MLINKMIPMKTKKDQIIQIIQESMMLKAGVPNTELSKTRRRIRQNRGEIEKKNPQLYLLVN